MEPNRLADIRAQLEEEVTWRQDEIRLLHNQLSFVQSETDKKRLRKALIVMLYSHYEGFCSTALQIYIKSINDENLMRKDLNYHLAACSLSSEFNAYDDQRLKPSHYRQIFKNKLPDETRLHRFARQVDFVKNMDGFWEQAASIPDDIVNTESNLWPIVLKKLLYRLGLPEDSFKEEEGSITELMNRRNAIAHGSNKEGCDEKTYENIKKSVFRIFGKTIRLIMDTLAQKEYLLSS
ncbi:hypothetical protein EU245_08490 [Lentibacillus lipolyticus]|nr:hypothetical protein EU245_08490 [Lentibacillus lipolyticus]